MASLIKICMGSSCFARGNSKNLQVVQKFLKSYDLDAKIELTGLRCCNQCSKGPNITIDDIEYNNIESDALYDILEKHYHDKIISGDKNV